jgi:tRNA nucleotidyltransferase (CCA-adding enzyme)
MASWEHFPHEADVGVRGRGESADVSFEQAALALTAVITNPDLIRNEEQVEIACEAPSLDVLLVDWLNAVIYEMTTRSMLFGRFRVKINGLKLSAQAQGEHVDRQRHEPVVEPKGATFTELRVSRDDEAQWVAQCVVDV